MTNYLVYKHTSPSGKMYIGITNDYSRRCREHISSANRGLGYVFHDAIRKYGWNSFKHEIVIDNLTLEEVCNFEVILIKELDTMAPKGYNIVEGGNVMSGTTSRQLQLKARKGKFKGYTFSESKYHVTRSYLRKNLHFKSFVLEEEAEEYSVWLYTLTDEELLNEYTALCYQRTIPEISVNYSNNKYRVRATLDGKKKSFGSFSAKEEAELFCNKLQGLTVEELSKERTKSGTKGYYFDKKRNRYRVNFMYKGVKVAKVVYTEQEAKDYVASIHNSTLSD